MRKVSGLVAALAVAAAVGACSDKITNIAENINVHGDTSQGIGQSGKVQLTLTPKTLICRPGDVPFQFSVAIANTLNGDQSFRTRSSNPNIATIDQTAQARCLTPGTDTVTTLANADSTARQSAVITVLAPAHVDTTVVLAKTADTLTTCAGVTKTVSAKVLLNGVESSVPVTFSSSDTTIAVVSSSGVVTGRKSGFVIITARAGNATGQETILVNACPPPPPPPPPSGISISVTPTVLNLSLGNCNKLTGVLAATVTNAQTGQVVNKPVTWSVSGPLGVAAMKPFGNTDTVSAAGVGVVTITASATGDDGVTHSVSATINVGNCPSTSVITAVLVQPSNDQLFNEGPGCSTGQIFTFLTEVKAGDTLATDQGVIYSVSQPGYILVDAQGHVTTASPIQFGTVAVKVAAHGNPAVFHTTNVTIANNPCPGTSGGTVGFSPESGTLNVGQQVNLTPFTANCSVFNAVTNPVTWASSRPDFLVVSKAGVITGIAAGQATVTASVVGCAPGGGSFTVQAVTQPSPTITVNGPTTLAISAQATYTATVTNAPDPTVTWSSSDPSSIIIDSQSGIAKGIWHSAPGGVEIDATLRANVLYKGILKVNVP